VSRINGEKVGSMSALTRRGRRGLFLDLFDLLDPLDMLHLWFGGRAMRIEDGIQNGRYMVRAEMPGIDPARQAEATAAKGILTIQAERPEGDDSTIGLKPGQAADQAGRSIPIRLVQHIKPT
jgi:hypothetical protein